MTTPSISGITTLGKVQSENMDLSNNIITIPLPSLDLARTTASTINSNLLGKVRKVVFTGIIVGDETTLKNFVANIEAWINDGFQTTRQVTTALNNKYNMLCDDFNYDIVVEETLTIMNYTLELVEGGLIS